MGSLADFEFNKAPLCDGMVLISEQVRDDFPTHFVEEELQRLLRLAQEEIAPSWDQERQIERLLALFYEEWGFGASQGVYRLSDALWLDKVLVNRQGSAVSLGAILLWIAQRLGLPVVPVIFPTQMLLRADPETSEEMWLINPFNGETLDEHTLEVWLKGNIGRWRNCLMKISTKRITRGDPQAAGHPEVGADGRAADGAGPARQRSAAAV